MSILGTLFGGGIAEPIKAIGNIIDDVYTSDEEKLSKKEAMARLAMKPHMVQTEINKVEAQHRSPFVAGWRPFIGWVCGAGLGMSFIINPFIQWWTGNPGPEMPLDAMMTLVTALLGLGAMRTFEKMNGKSK
jgi:hypothetical protein